MAPQKLGVVRCLYIRIWVECAGWVMHIEVECVGELVRVGIERNGLLVHIGYESVGVEPIAMLDRTWVGPIDLRH
jgi:hypothetical protein